MVDQALLGQPPVVISTGSNPSGELAKALEIGAGDPSKQSSHVGHELEWHQLLDIQPLAVPLLGHRLRNLAMATCQSSLSKGPTWATQQQPTIWVRSRFYPEAM